MEEEIDVVGFMDWVKKKTKNILHRSTRSCYTGLQKRFEFEKNKIAAAPWANEIDKNMECVCAWKAAGIDRNNNGGNE